jgi:hypothetical protein
LCFYPPIALRQDWPGAAETMRARSNSSSPGTRMPKIAAYYADPVKQAYDKFAITNAFWLKSMSIDRVIAWAARRPSDDGR